MIALAGALGPPLSAALRASNPGFTSQTREVGCVAQRLVALGDDLSQDVGMGVVVHDGAFCVAGCWRTGARRASGIGCRVWRRGSEGWVWMTGDRVAERTSRAGQRS